MMVEVVLIALATARITRLITTDKIAETPRLRVQLYFEQRWEERTGKGSDDTWGSRFAYLISCQWCTSIYVAAGTTAATSIFASVPLPVLTALAASSVTGLLAQLTD